MNICWQRHTRHHHYGLTTTAPLIGVWSVINHQSGQLRLSQDSTWVPNLLIWKQPYSMSLNNITNLNSCSPEDMRGLSEETTGTGCIITSSSGWVQQHDGMVTPFCSFYSQVHSSSTTTTFLTLPVFPMAIMWVKVEYWPGLSNWAIRDKRAHFLRTSFVGTKRCFDNHGRGYTLDYKMIGDSKTEPGPTITWLWIFKFPEMCLSYSHYYSLHEGIMSLMSNFCKMSPRLTGSLSRASYFSPCPPFFCSSSTLPFLSLTTDTSSTATFNFHYTCAKAYAA